MYCGCMLFILKLLFIYLLILHQFLSININNFSARNVIKNEKQTIKVG